MRTGLDKLSADTEMGIGAQQERIRVQTLSESLQARKVNLERQLHDIDAAISALKAHPEVENVINLINRI